MSWIFSPNSPVFVQITEELKRKILTGEYPPDSQLPSVRTIAEQAGVNPNTVQRSLTLLEDQGLVVTRGTIGRFVTSDRQKIQNCFGAEIDREIDAFLCRMSVYGVTKEKAAELIKNKEDDKV